MHCFGSLLAETEGLIRLASPGSEIGTQRLNPLDEILFTAWVDLVQVIIFLADVFPFETTSGGVPYAVCGGFRFGVSC